MGIIIYFQFTNQTSKIVIFILEDNQEELIKLAHSKMPFGKFKNSYLIDLPESYIVWFKNKGFPKGKLGEQLQLIYELKLNGLEDLIRNIKKKYPKE
jgi:uncharacterized protein